VLGRIGNALARRFVSIGVLKLSHWSGCGLPKSVTNRFSRLDELSSVDLAKVRLYDGTRWLPRSVGAITLSVPIASWIFGSTRIYFCGAWAPHCSLETPQGIELLAEELFHAKQQLEIGAARFYVLYLWEYFQHRRRGLKRFAAYNAISFEQEAKAFARAVAARADGYAASEAA
jgi:hypothetical protein